MLRRLALALAAAALSSTVAADPIQITIGPTGRVGDDAPAVAAGDPVVVAPNYTAVQEAMLSHVDGAAPSGWISADRAVAVARERKLAKGVLPWRVALDFDPGLGRPVWRITTTEVVDAYRREGRTVVVDAESGTARRTDRWHVWIS